MNTGEIDPTFGYDMLLEVYIGQEINSSRGILHKLKNSPIFDEEKNKKIEMLLEAKLVALKTPYAVRSIVTLVTTEIGENKAKLLIENILQNQSILDELADIPRKALGFFLLNMNSRIFERERQSSFVDWKDFILYKTKMFEYLQKFCAVLDKKKLAVRTNDYVSSNGGNIIREKYVVPDEVKEYLIKSLDTIPFSVDETYQATLFYTMYRIRKEIMPVNGEEKRRNTYWNLLGTLPFDESIIKQFVGQFQKEGITTEYLEIEKEHFLFSIIDLSRYDLKLEKMLGAFVSGVLEGERKIEEVLLPKASSKPSELLRLHSDLFKLIGNFEMRFREYLISEMRAAFKENEYEWYGLLREISLKDALTSDNQSPVKNLYDKLQFRKNQDERNKIWPEDELIYYADITDYKEIILRNWKIFEGRFKQIDLTKEKFEHGMNELNKIRRKVMHLRDITPSEANTTRLYIIPILEEVFV